MFKQVLDGFWKAALEFLAPNWGYVALIAFALISNGTWVWKRSRYKGAIKTQQGVIKYLEASNKDKELVIKKQKNEISILKLKQADEKSAEKIKKLRKESKDLEEKRKKRAAELVKKKKALQGKTLKQLADIVNGEW